MTKEELESQYEDCFDNATRPTEGGYGADMTDKWDLWKAFEPLISEYAKQQAIAYDRWKRENNYTIDYPNNQYIKLIVAGDKARTEMVPFDEVYNQFIEQSIK